MSEDEMLADRLHSVAIHLLRRVRRVDATTGIKPAELSALSVVVFGGPITLGDLALAEQVRPASMTRTVKLLESGGFISRSPDESDGRIAWLRTTPKGEKVMMQGAARELRSWLNGCTAFGKRTRNRSSKQVAFSSEFLRFRGENERCDDVVCDCNAMPRNRYWNVKEDCRYFG